MFDLVFDLKGLRSRFTVWADDRRSDEARSWVLISKQLACKLE